MSKKETFLILDGNALLHRAWHAIPPLTTKSGLVVNAAYGFTMTVEKMLDRFKPTYMAVAWDLPGGTFRNDIYEDYKGHREEKEQELYDQIPMIQDILDAYGIPSLDAEGYEADDVIATLSDKATKKGIFTYIITGDLDALQLVDETSHVVFFIKGLSETKTYDIAAVRERYDLDPEDLIDYKALRGDPSDNIPGVAGVGDKTATLLLKEHGDLEGIFKALEKDQIAEKFAKKLRGQEDVAFESRELVTLIHDVKVDFRFPSAKVKEADQEALLELFREFEFRTLLRKYGSKVEAPPVDSMDKASSKISVTVLREVKEVEALSFGKTIAVMIAEQQADLFGATRAALALSDGKQTVVITNPKDEHLAVAKKHLDAAELVVAHDLKQLMHQTDWVFENAFDVMIASYLLRSGTRSHDLQTIAHKQLDKKIPDVPSGFAGEKDYKRLGQIVSVLPALEKKLRKEMKKDGVEKVFDEIEMPCAPILYRMEKEGVKLDTGSLETFSKELAKRIKQLEKKLIKLGGREFNVNSPIQLAEILFDDLGLPTKGIKKTKTGYSTAASELEKLWDEHEIIPLISENRELTKLQSTYVEALPKLVATDGRIHTTYNQTVAATGRLSSSEPNLQNIPIKTELGREIRKTFVAPRGKQLIAADYSQIELRLVAVVAKDKPFISAFKEGADIHTRTAAEIWEIPDEKVTKEHRRAAKAINFGIIYGMGPRALSRSTNLSFNEAKEFIARYFDIHKAIRTYLDETKQKAHDDGYVETMFGRRRWFPEIHSGVPMLVAQAERMAINMPLQGAASDIMKMAMIETDAWIKKSKLPVTMLMQVHDELVFEVDSDAVEKVAKGIRKTMEGVVDFDVPLVVDVEVGKNWKEMKRI